jgi:transcriptional regulator with XRE-family HTH domain
VAGDRNNPASVALVALRKRLDMSQRTFADKILKQTITTVSRYESGNPPPRGEALLRLSKIAREYKSSELSARFRFLYLQEVLQSESPITMIPAEGETPARGYLTVPIEGKDQLRAAVTLHFWLQAMRGSLEPGSSERLLDALKEFESIVLHETLPGAGNTYEHLLSAALVLYSGKVGEAQ